MNSHCIMIDLYKDELYLHFQGKELKTIYENIFEQYEINMKKLLGYAKYRTNIKDFIEFIDILNIPKKYKLKRLLYVSRTNKIKQYLEETEIPKEYRKRLKVIKKINEEANYYILKSIK